MSEQPYRECLPVPLALEAAAQVLDLRGKFALLRNDAKAAIAALDRSRPRGGRRSRRRSGEEVNPESVVGPAVSDGLWGRIRAAVTGVGLDETVDAVATESNSWERRYWSRYAEPCCEVVDALSVGRRGKSRCPVCGGWPRDVFYAFPPAGLVYHVVRKAVVNAAVCVLVVPVPTTATHWMKLVRSSLLGAWRCPMAACDFALRERGSATRASTRKSWQRLCATSRRRGRGRVVRA